MRWKFYCPRCGKIKNRFQVAKGSDNVRLYWYLCRDCGGQVLELKDALERALGKVHNHTYSEEKTNG